jgi:hypothetical protein
VIDSYIDRNILQWNILYFGDILRKHFRPYILLKIFLHKVSQLMGDTSYMHLPIYIIYKMYCYIHKYVVRDCVDRNILFILYFIIYFHSKIFAQHFNQHVIKACNILSYINRISFYVNTTDCVYYTLCTCNLYLVLSRV